MVFTATRGPSIGNPVLQFQRINVGKILRLYRNLILIDATHGNRGRTLSQAFESNSGCIGILTVRKFGRYHRVESQASRIIFLLCNTPATIFITQVINIGIKDSFYRLVKTLSIIVPLGLVAVSQNQRLSVCSMVLKTRVSLSVAAGNSIFPIRVTYRPNTVRITNHCTWIRAAQRTVLNAARTT